MAAVSDVAALAFHLAHGCARIMEPLLCFLGGPSPRSPAVDAAAVSLLVVLVFACLAFIFVAHFAGVAHLSAPAVSFAELGRFAAMVFTLVSAWLLVFAGLLVAFYLISDGMRGIGPGLTSCNVLS